MYFPLNILVGMVLSFILALFKFSFFFREVSIQHGFYVFVIGLGVILQYIFCRKYLISQNNYYVNCNGYKFYLILAILIFLIEFFIYGTPAFNLGGRDETGVLPFFHVLGYSYFIFANLLVSMYGGKKQIIICSLIIVLFSILLLSRQLLMCSIIITILSLLWRYPLSYKFWMRLLLLLVILTFLFGTIGNYRQNLSNDYVSNYIFLVGGANKEGEKIGDALFWIWLYLASPMYNLLINFDSYYDLGNKCNSAIDFGSCNGNYISSVLFPDVLNKYFGLKNFLIDLQISHLNVGTGFATAARLNGILGVFLQMIFQVLFFIFGYKLTNYRYRNAFIIYYSSLSLFLIFDNLFTRAEFFFVFILLFLVHFKFKVFSK